MAVGDLLSYAVIGFVAVRLVTGARVAASRAGRTLVAEVVSGIRWRHIWPVPIVLTVVIAAALVLMEVPGLSWGWWSVIGGQGNPVFGSTDSTTGTPAEWLIPLTFVMLLLPALPLFAHAEERLFRAGAESWSTRRRVSKTLQFGLVHALIGIPIGAAIALSIGGAYFMSVYLRAYAETRSSRAATIASTTAHTAYNACILISVALALLWAGAASLGGS